MTLTCVCLASVVLPVEASAAVLDRLQQGEEVPLTGGSDDRLGSRPVAILSGRRAASAPLEIHRGEDSRERQLLVKISGTGSAGGYDLRAINATPTFPPSAPAPATGGGVVQDQRKALSTSCGPTSAGFTANRNELLRSQPPLLYSQVPQQSFSRADESTFMTVGPSRLLALISRNHLCILH